METVYRIKASELNKSFLDSVKMLFKKREIEISISDIVNDETEYLLSSPSNRKMLEDSINSEEGYEFSLDEFKKFSNELKNGKQTDFSKVRKVKLPK